MTLIIHFRADKNIFLIILWGILTLRNQIFVLYWIARTFRLFWILKYYCYIHIFSFIVIPNCLSINHTYNDYGKYSWLSYISNPFWKSMVSKSQKLDGVLLGIFKNRLNFNLFKRLFPYGSFPFKNFIKPNSFAKSSLLKDLTYLMVLVIPQ